MANNRLIAVCLRCSTDEFTARTCIAKYYPSVGWYGMDELYIKTFFDEHMHGTHEGNEIVFIPEICDSFLSDSELKCAHRMYEFAQGEPFDAERNPRP